MPGGIAIFTLPAGYRPDARKRYNTYGSVIAEITEEGEVKNFSSTPVFHLDGISFRAAQ